MVDRSNVKMGKNVYIAENVVLHGDIEVGDNSRIFEFTILKDKTKIGSYTTIGNHVCGEPEVTIGSHCSIWSQSHLTSGLIIEDRVFMAPMFMGTNTRKISYGREYEVVREAPIIRYGARIGANVVVLPGVEIGEQALIGAGSVVTKNVPSREVWAGNPAKKLRDVPKEELLPEDLDD
jgi:UDP-2-acetamido-3-amino-2,3-dideoxy-glucuronate N-acetyltransferase